jgi:hypothetical protein
VCYLRDTEVHYFHASVGKKHDICGLDVAMQNTIEMSVMETLRDLGHNLRLGQQCHLRSARDDMLEIAALD